MADLSKLRFNGTDYNVKDASAPLRKFTNYSKTGNLPITSDDTTQTAIGKLEKALDDKINTSAKGTSNGVAELDANGKVPSSQLPSYVDDVLEYSAKSSFPATGETGKIYVDTTTNKTYRWSGSAYVEISESLALGETSSTAYRGDRGKAAYDHSQITNGNPHGTTGANTNLTGYSKGSSKDAVAATDTVNAAIAKHENRINTNQTNILSVLNRTGKNVINIQAPTSTRGCTFTTGNNGAVNLTNTENWSQFVVENVHVKANTQYKFVIYMDAISNLPAFNVYLRNHDKDGSALIDGFTVSSTGTIVKDFTSVSDTISLNIYPNNQSTTVSGTATFRVMICEKTLYDLSNEYTWGLPNSDLTYLEAEDRAALAEVVDSGAKNLCTNSSITSQIVGNFSDVSWFSEPIPAGTYVLRATVTSAQPSQMVLVNANNTALATVKPTVSSGTNVDYISEPFTLAEAAKGFKIYSNANPTTWTDIMICTKAAFGVSPKFVPYRYDPYTTVVQNVKNTTLYAKRNGRTITVNGYVDNISFTAGSSTTLGTINDEIGKPLQQVRSICSIGANAYSFGESAYLAIAPDGNVVVTPKTYTGTGAVFFSVSYTI